MESSVVGSYGAITNDSRKDENKKMNMEIPSGEARFKFRYLLALVLGVAIVGLMGRLETSSTIENNWPTSFIEQFPIFESNIPVQKFEIGFQKAPKDIYIYKRTSPTTNPYEDCALMGAALGMSTDTYEITEDASTPTGYCGLRCAATAGDFSFHNLRDFFLPLGDAEEWIKRINAAHGATWDISTMNKKWDAFMSFNVGFFTPDLRLVLERWIKLGIPYRAHWYKNPSDSATMYALFTFNPNTGEVLEVHGESLDSTDSVINNKLIDTYFTEMPKDACILALATGFSVSVLVKEWDDSTKIREYTGNNGLPYIMPIKVSHPSIDTAGVTNWMEFNANVTYKTNDSDDDQCKVASSFLKKYRDVGHVNVMFVEDTRKAYKEEIKQVAEWISHVQDIHDKRLGTQRGWDRWLDNHVGLIYSGIHLDDIAPTLKQNGVGFKAFRDTYEGDQVCKDGDLHEQYCGSLWTGGHSALGYEFHSFFDPDFKFFNGDFAPTYMNFCDAENNRGNTKMYDDDKAMDDW